MNARVCIDTINNGKAISDAKAEGMTRKIRPLLLRKKKKRRKRRGYGEKREIEKGRLAAEGW